MAERLLIRGGRVIDPARKLDGVRDVLLEDDKIARVEAGLAKRRDLKSVRSIDAAGLWVAPGLIDLHVHLREPGGETDETIASGTAAAARGGVTTVVAMPNTEPAVDTPELVRKAAARAREQGKVNVLIAAAATLGRKGERLTEIPGLVKAGAVAVTDDGNPVATAELMRRGLEYARDCGIPVIDHCEDKSLSGSGVMNEGRTSAVKGLRGIPCAAESVIAWRDIQIAELTGGRLHLAHVSAAETARALREAKRRGLAVTAESAPHHWTLCDEDIPGFDPNFKMNPPLRSARDRDAIREALADGTIDAIATDHAPHGQAKKAAGFDAAPFGVIGLETSLALGLTVLVGKKILGPSRLIELMSAAPARILGLRGKGTLRPGADGDIILIDPKARWKVGVSFVSLSRNSPFVGRELAGRVKATFVGGRMVYADL